MTGPDRAADGDRLAIVDAAHERVRVPLGEGAPFGYDPRPVQEGDRPAPKARADLSGLAACALQWLTAPRRYGPG